MKREEQSGTLPAQPVGSHQSALARRKRLRQIVIPYVFLIPFLILFALFLVLPLAYAFWISIFEERLVGGSTFVGVGLVFALAAAAGSLLWTSRLP